LHSKICSGKQLPDQGWFYIYHAQSLYWQESSNEEPITTFVPMEVQIHEEWKTALQAEFSKTYFQQIVLHLKTERAGNKVIFPPGSLIFNAFNSTPFSQVKVVILGQDPYHGPGQAMGLSFSVPRGVSVPPSLNNIYKEIKSDLGLQMPNHGDLSGWAKQGVLLLNAALTVRANEPNSHAQIGWHHFTDAVIRLLSAERAGLVFLLWGRFAQDKQTLIDETRHAVLKAAHPSPFSAEKGFFGCRHFSKTNHLLMKAGIDPVDWKLPD
jgi:uracil-DNA glycosylase